MRCLGIEVFFVFTEKKRFRFFGGDPLSEIFFSSFEKVRDVVCWDKEKVHDGAKKMDI